MTTLLEKLKFLPSNLTNDSDVKFDKTATRRIFKFRQATWEPPWQGLNEDYVSGFDICGRFTHVGTNTYYT